MAISPLSSEDTNTFSLLADPVSDKGLGVQVKKEEEILEEKAPETDSTVGPEDDVSERTSLFPEDDVEERTSLFPEDDVADRPLFVGLSPLSVWASKTLGFNKQDLKDATETLPPLNKTLSEKINPFDHPLERQLLLRFSGYTPAMQKDIAATVAKQTYNFQRTINYLKHRNNLPKDEQKKLDDDLKKQSKEIYSSILETAGAFKEAKEPLFDLNTGKIINTNTALTGVLAEMAVPITTGLAATTVTGPIGGLIVGSLTYGALMSPDENLTNMLNDLGFDAVPEKRDELLDAIFKKELSQEDKDRATLAIEEVMLIGAGPVLIKGTQVVKGVNQALMTHFKPLLDSFKKPYELLTDEEKAQLTFDALRSAGQQVRRQAGGKQGFFGPIKNMYSAAERVAKQFFKSAGFAPQPLRELGENQKNKARSSLQKASTVATKLDTLINELAGKTSNSSDDIKKAVTDALTKGIDLEDNFALVPPGETIPSKKLLEAKDVFELLRNNKDYDALSDEILNVVVEARGNIDSLTNQLIKSLELDPDSDLGKTQINTLKANVATYLNTSYRIFDDGWTVDANLYQEAIKKYTKQFIERDPTLDPEKAETLAAEFVDKFIGNQRQNLQNNSNAVSDAHRRDTSKLEPQDLTDPTLRKLAGEVTDSSEIVLKTSSNLINLVTESQYFDEVYKLGTNSEYPFIFSAAKQGDSSTLPFRKGAEERSIYSYEIKGTNSKLDGMFTTPEIGLVLQNRETSLTPILGAINTKKAVTNPGLLTAMGLNPTVASFAQLKGLTQKFKTVWSIQTHVRNGLGGLFMNVAQGHNPFNKDMKQIFKVISSKTDKELMDYKADLLELGVINTSPRLREFKELLSEYNDIMGSAKTSATGAESFLNFMREKVVRKLGTKDYNLETLDDYMQKVYMGTDDFFKISLFEKEKAVLKKAYPDLSEESLSKEAAEIVKNQMPNYDRVTPGIKSLRNVPVFGAFVSFSEEVLRTGSQTILQANREILSGNPELMKRGALRLSSFALVAGSGTKATEYASGKAMGWTEEQIQAVKTFYDRGYGAQRYLFIKGENGQVDKLNLTMTDPWTILAQPFAEATQARLNGELTKEEESEIQFDKTLSFVEATLRPYFSETVFNQAMWDFQQSLTTGKRMSPGGYYDDIAGEKNNITANLPRAFTNLLFDLGPNVLKEAKQFKDIMIDEDVGGPYLEPKDKEDYISSRLTTLPRSPVNLIVDLEGHIRNYKYDIQNAKPTNLRRIDSYEELVNKFKKANENHLKASQELYIKFKAVEDFYSVDSKGRRLAQARLKEYTDNNFNIHLVSKGISPVMEVNKIALYDSLEALRKEGKLPYNYVDFDEAMDKFALEIGLSREERDINKLQDYSEQRILQKNYAVGGEVDVPRAAPEPDERIDKMTGLPYNIQAGIPFRDEEDPIKRLGLAGGGMTSDPMQRLGFAAGGVRKGVEAVIKTKEKVSENVLEAIEQGENFAYQALKYLVEPKDVPRSIAPVPQRKFDPTNKEFSASLGKMGEQPGGRYLEMGDGPPKEVTGEFPAKAVIGVNSEGKPTLNVSKKLLEGETKKEGRKIKTNLFKKKAGWKWTKVPKGFNPNPSSNFSIVSVEDGKQHYFSLRTEFPEGAELTRYEKKKTEPRLRPTKKGNVHLGKKVGEISVRGRKHPVYDQIQVYGIAGAATGTSLLDKEETDSPQRKGLAEGSKVDPSMFRSDGSQKSSTGFLGPIKNNITRGTMTEFSTDMLYEGEKIEIPTLVPTQSKEAIEYMQNMEPGTNWNMKDPMAKQIINTARKHAKMRLDQGKSQFYVDGEEQRLKKAEGSLLDYVLEKSKSTSAISADKQMNMAKKLGFNEQDLKDATTFGETYSRASQDGGKGDAARHIMLGWATAQTDNPATAYKIITARDVGLGLVGGEGKLGVEMDLHNNKLGFNLGKLSKEKAQKEARKLIESGEAKTIR